MFEPCCVPLTLKKNRLKNRLHWFYSICLEIDLNHGPKICNPIINCNRSLPLPSDIWLTTLPQQSKAVQSLTKEDRVTAHSLDLQSTPNFTASFLLILLQNKRSSKHATAFWAASCCTHWGGDKWWWVFRELIWVDLREYSERGIKAWLPWSLGHISEESICTPPPQVPVKVVQAQA